MLNFFIRVIELFNLTFSAALGVPFFEFMIYALLFFLVWAFFWFLIRGFKRL